MNHILDVWHVWFFCSSKYFDGQWDYGLSFQRLYNRIPISSFNTLLNQMFSLGWWIFPFSFESKILAGKINKAFILLLYGNDGLKILQLRGSRICCFYKLVFYNFLIVFLLYMCAYLKSANTVRYLSVLYLCTFNPSLQLQMKSLAIKIYNLVCFSWPVFLTGYKQMYCL